MCPLYILKDDEDVRQRCKPEFIYQELVMSPFCCSLQWHSIWIFYYLIKTSKSRLHENKIGVAERDKLHHKKMVEIWSNSLAHSFRGKETLYYFWQLPNDWKCKPCVWNPKELSRNSSQMLAEGVSHQSMVTVLKWKKRRNHLGG